MVRCDAIDLADGMVDGEELLFVPRYDFDWQLDYTFSDPVLIEEGSEIEAILVWENDSGREVGYGEGTEDEMGFVHLLYTRPGERLAAPASRVGD